MNVVIFKVNLQFISDLPRMSPITNVFDLDNC